MVAFVVHGNFILDRDEVLGRMRLVGADEDVDQSKTFYSEFYHFDLCDFSSFYISQSSSLSLWYYYTIIYIAISWPRG